MKTIVCTLLFPLLAPACAFHVAVPRTIVGNTAVSIKLTSPIASPFPAHIKSIHALHMADDDAASEKLAKKIVGRKKRVIMGNRIASVLYFLSAPMAIRNRVQNGGALLACYFAAGPFLAGGIAYILSGAASNDRLSSDTYKRLNVFLAKYGFINLMVAFLYSLKPRDYPIYIGSSLIAFINSIKGYGYGVKGWSLKNGDPVGDLVNMASSSVAQLLKPPKNIKSAGYQALSLTLACAKLIKLSEVVKFSIGCEWDFAVSRLMRYSKLMLMTIVSLTLRDAADRDRLEGTTFIQLNFLNSAALGTMAAYLCKGSEITPLAGAIGFFSVFSAFNGATSLWRKKAGSEN